LSLLACRSSLFALCSLLFALLTGL
jgi:hypothetical protein